MGHEIEKTAIERGHEIVAYINSTSDWQNCIFPDCDVAIDFSTPDKAPAIINRFFDENIAVISGTTGWNEGLAIVRQRAIHENKTFFYSSNFSIGVNIFFEVNKYLASLLSNLKSYHVNIQEVHHIHKKDAPSGTAITIAESIIDTSEKYSGWAIDHPAQNEIPISSERVGEIPGTHLIEWNSDMDTIHLKHIAHNRKGFVLGAIIAAEWVKGKKGVFDMSNLLNLGTKIE